MRSFNEILGDCFTFEVIEEPPVKILHKTRRLVTGSSRKDFFFLECRYVRSTGSVKIGNTNLVAVVRAVKVLYAQRDSSRAPRDQRVKLPGISDLQSLALFLLGWTNQQSEEVLI